MFLYIQNLNLCKNLESKLSICSVDYLLKHISTRTLGDWVFLLLKLEIAFLKQPHYFTFLPAQPTYSV